MFRLFALILASGLALPWAAWGQEYSATATTDGPPADELSAEVAAALSSTGIKVTKGESRTVCEIWPVKAWATKADFQPTTSMLYPFEPGQLLGVLRFKRSTDDFRRQQIPSGVYTLRYGLQPEDGNHVGTSDTRDFVLMLPAGEDTSPAAIDLDRMIELSAQAAGTTHPAMLSLMKAEGEGDSLPAIDHDEAREWWSVRFANPTLTGGKAGSLTIELIVVGHAAE